MNNNLSEGATHFYLILNFIVIGFWAFVHTLVYFQNKKIIRLNKEIVDLQKQLLTKKESRETSLVMKTGSANHWSADIEKSLLDAAMRQKGRHN